MIPRTKLQVKKNIVTATKNILSKLIKFYFSLDCNLLKMK